MGPGKSIYREIHEERRAVQTVRNLINAGFESSQVETKTLFPDTVSASDADRGPRRKALAYTLYGLAVGAPFGVVMAIVVFWIPAFFLQVPYAALITWVGLLVFIPAGIGLGLLEFFKRAKRNSREGKSSDGKTSIGVRVHAEDPRERGLAESVFAASEVRDVRYSNGYGKNR